MLKSFRVSNFRNLVNVEFRPAGCNLLIGPNNAGKTNLCSAMRFVALSASLNLEQSALMAVGETWNLANVDVREGPIEFDLDATLQDGSDTLDFSYSLRLTVSKNVPSLGVVFRTADERLVVSGGGFLQAPLLICQDGRAKLMHEESFLAGRSAGSTTTAEGDATMLSRVYDIQANRRTVLFKQYLLSWLYFNLSPQALRQWHAGDRPGLYADGGNLSKSMFWLHNELPRIERRVIDALKVVEPKVDVLTFLTPDPKSVFMFLEDQAGNRFGTFSMSDGSLRYLALAYLIHAYADERVAPSFAPVIMIEEPENGLYVGQLRPLFEKIDSSGKAGQFIFTSHSPYFIDLFERNLGGVHLMKPGKPSAVLIRPDADKVNQLLQTMPLGELHYREMLS